MPAGDETRYRCGTAARWLPRALAGSVLAVALMVAYDVDPEGQAWGSGVFRGLLGAAGGIAALWIVRRGGELRGAVRPGRDAVAFERGRGEAEVGYRELVELDWSPPLGPSRSWLPALLLVERSGRAWRVPGLLRDGERLLAEILERAGRDDLRAWAEARALERRMAGAGRRVAAGYAVAAALAVLAALVHLR